MKKVFLVGLILVSVLLLGSIGTALAQCMYYQDYVCSGVEKQDGYVSDIYTTCMGLCYNDMFEVGMYGEWFYAYLYPLDGKNLLGTAASMYDWAGCSVELNARDRSATVILSYIQEDEGYTDTLKCTPCDSCCE